MISRFLPLCFVLTGLPLAATAQDVPTPRAEPVPEADDARPPKAEPVSEPDNGEPVPKATPVDDPPAPDEPDESETHSAELAANQPTKPQVIPEGLADKQGNYAPIPDNKTDTDTIVRIQIHLDQNNHGPGYIDGKLGEFGKKAASVYNQVRGIPVGNWYPLIKASAKTVPQPYTTYKITAGDFRFVIPVVPSKPKDQVKLKYLGYGGIGEFVAERFHTTEDYLAELNKGGKSPSRWKAGDVVKVPNVKPFELENVKQHSSFPKDSVLSTHAVVVDIAARVAIFFDDNKKVIASFPITPGKAKFIQFGEWKLTTMITTPEFRWDKEMLENGKRSGEYFQLPIGPNSPVGIFWTGTSRTGIGLHGTSSPHTIGRSESHGCVRFANWDAIRLPTIIRPGARLVIR